MASLIDNMDLIQGDSSTIFKFGESTGKELDINWEASFAIIETDPNTPIISRTLSKDDEKLKHQKALKELLKGLNEALAKDLKDLEEMLGDEEDE